MEHLPRFDHILGQKQFQQIGRFKYVLWPVSGILKTNPQVSDSLERLAEFRKAVILTVSIDYNKVYRLQYVKGIGRVWEKPGSAFQRSSPSGVRWTALNSPGMTWDNA